MITFPNAKINIGLDVLRKRGDGYHDISTVMMPVPWCDVLEIVPSNNRHDSLHVSGRAVDCPPEKNLVMKAVTELRKYGEFPPVDLFLNKIIPDGAGLGGGSADAAFTLTAINSLFELNYPKEKLAVIASGLGADCPFFIYNQPMLCEGTGTTMSPFSLVLPKKLKVVIIKPSVSVATKEAYAGIAPEIPATPLPEILSELPLNKWQGIIKNDFEKSVFPLYPVIATVKQWLLDNGAVYASMSGSGSSVFAFFEGDILTDEIKSQFPEYDIFVSKI